LSLSLSSPFFFSLESKNLFLYLSHSFSFLFSHMTSSASLYITQIRFCRALAVVRSLPTSTNGAFKPSIAERLNFYGLYKQAVSGDCQLLRPSSRLAVQYAKW
jgi:acyl-CoA-binding protein